MSYNIVLIRVDPSLKDYHISELWELGAKGIEEKLYEMVAYFDMQADLNKIKEVFKEYLISITKKEDEDWMENWKENFKPQFIEDTFIIKPTWEEVEAKEGQIVIDIDPKMAFGTGTHETTQLVLGLMPKYHHRSNTVFDFGTGSGILAVAAEKLGSTSILAVDIDDISMQNVEENMKLNSCKHIIFNKMSLHSIDKSFNFIVANINKHILLSESEHLMKKLEKNGILILSGLLEYDENDIKEKYKTLEFIERKQKNEWIALVFKK